MNKIIRALTILTAGLLFSGSVEAEVITTSPDRYVLKHEATSDLAPDALWARLIKPASWWHPDHTFSGKSENLSLDVQAGGLWREDWDGGSVAHGTVIFVKPSSTLRMNAPFGPLQERAVTVIWTITISPTENGSKIVFDETANGTTESGLDELAPAVDFVKGEAIKRLAGDIVNK